MSITITAFNNQTAQCRCSLCGTGWIISISSGWRRVVCPVCRHEDSSQEVISKLQPVRREPTGRRIKP